MNLVWTPYAWEDYLYWQETNEKLLKRINLLIKDMLRSPYEGIGKPEPLKFDLAGKWSRKINDEHRLVYEIVSHEILTGKKKISQKVLIMLQCRYHY